MMRYLRIYRSFLRFSFINFITYRAYTINAMVSTLAWGVFQFIWIQLLTVQTKSAFGWSRDELVILAIVYIVVIGVFHFLFSRNFDRFTTIIDKGELDFLLLKPVDSQFIASCFISHFPNLVRTVLGTVLLIGYVSYRHIPISMAGVVGFLVLILFGILLLYSLWLFYSTLLIWFPRLTNINDFLYTINGMGRYPTEMIEGMKNFVIFFLLPFSIAIAAPTKVLVRGTLHGEVFGLIALTVGMLVFTRLFWLYALRHYTSASS